RRVEPAVGCGTVGVVSATGRREQEYLTLLVGFGEEDDPFGEAAGVREPVAAEFGAVDEDAAGILAGRADLELELRGQAGDLLYDAAGPLAVSWQGKFARVAGADAGVVSAGVEQFRARRGGVGAGGVGDPVYVGQARVLGEKVREGIGPVP